MKCLYLVLALIALVSSVLADSNIYKKDFDKTGKAYYFHPSKELSGKKIAIGENCTKVVVTMLVNGQTVSPSETTPLSANTGTYHAEIIRFPGGKCQLPETQKCDKEVINATPEELVKYYEGEQGPKPKYEFKTDNKSEGSGFFKNKIVVIGIIAVAALLVVILISFLACSRKKNTEDDDYRRFSSNDKDMKQISEPYIGLSNDSKESYSLSKPFNTNKSIPTPITNYNNWNSPIQDSPKMNSSTNNNSLAPPNEPKRVTSITFEEQQNFSNLLKKNMNNDNNGYGKKNIPDEYEKYKTYKVVRKFTPQRNDELVVENGHLLKMIKSFEDGWSLCYNVDTKKEGYIPKNKLAPVDQIQKPQNIMHTDTTSTSSSAYSTKPLLHNSSNASSYSNNSSYNRTNRGPAQRGVNSRNNSGNSRGSPPKYYNRKPSNDNYINSYQRSPNQRYDM